MTTQTDRKLLEAAARAAGLAVDWRESVQCLCYSSSPYNVAWNPLTDDGDAFRLAVRLGMSMTLYKNPDETWAAVGITPPCCREPHGSDPYAATRRAIVCAAAALDTEAKP
jgi:hypothetical protein